MTRLSLASGDRATTIRPEATLGDDPWRDPSDYTGSMDTTSVSLLVRLENRSDRDAWARFVELYTPLIYFWARRTGLPSEDASDLVQDVLELLVRKLPTFEYQRNKSFRGWLRTITLNKWREHCRRKRLAIADVSDSELANMPDARGDEAFWDTEYRQQLVTRAMELLSVEFQPATWQAVREYVVHSRTADEAAQLGGVSVWTVYAAKSRLLRRLREELDGLLD